MLPNLLNRLQKKINNQVLGETNPDIYINSAKNYSYGYGRSEVISLTSLEEPAINLSSYNGSGEGIISIYKINKDYLIKHLVYNNEGKIIDTNYDLENLELVKDLTFQINKGSATKLTLPIEDSGIWLLKVNFQGTIDHVHLIRSQNGVLTKEGDNELIFWAQNYENKRSVPDGRFELYSLADNAQKLAEGSADSQGIFTSQIDSKIDIGIFESDSDIALIPINLKRIGSEWDLKWDEFTPAQRISKFFTFIDRPIYKPGDKIYFKSIIRDDDDGRYSIPGDLATVKIYEGWTSDENLIYEKNYQISADGTIDGYFDLDPNAKTGNYTMKISVDENNSSYKYFDVTYYRKPEYFIEVDTDQNEYIAKDKITAKVNANYFSGEPVSGGQVSYKVYSSNYYNSYYYSEETVSLNNKYRYGYWYGNEVTSGTIDLNEYGQAEIIIDTIIPENKAQNQVYSIEVEYIDQSADPAFRRKNILVYAGQYDVYRQTDSQYNGKINEAFSMPIIIKAHNPDLNLNNIELTGKLVHTDWVEKYSEDQKYPRWEQVTEDISVETIKTDSEGKATFSYTPSQKGSYTYEVELKDKQGNLVKKEFSFYITDKNFTPYNRFQQEQKISVKTDKEIYYPGETAKLTISSSIENRDIFFSIDRAKVNEYQIVKLDGNGTILDITLPKDYMPNIFATVSSFSNEYLDTDTEEIAVSPYSQNLSIEILPENESYGPGETMNVKIQTKDNSGNPIPANLAFWAVDKAIFELVEKDSTDIFNAFWRERYNGTSLTHSLIGINSNGAERGGCFDGDTQILMANNKNKKISDVKIGDKILTKKSEEDSNLVKAKVLDIHKTTVDGYLIINDNLKITTYHKIWLNGKWQEANFAKIGDKLIDKNGNQIIINSIEWLRGNFTVYNLYVDKYNTFFANDIYVHNQKGGTGRSVFKDTAYWNPNVQTDNNGYAQLSIKLPDNLTTWVLSSIANTKDTIVGDNTAEVIVRKDFVIRPILPNLFRIGDETKVKALVHNFTEQDKIFDAHFLNSEADIKNSTQSGIALKAGQQKELVWDLDFTKENLQSEFNFAFWDQENEGIGDNVIVKVPVHEFGFSNKYAFSNIGEKQYNINFSPKADLTKTSATLHISSSLINSLPVAMEYLIHYPYGCVEQTTSSLYPIIIAKENPQLYSKALAKYSQEEINEMVTEGLSRLKKAQKYSGGWAWWDHVEETPFIIVYVLEALVRLKNLDYPVEDNLIDQARQYLLSQKEKSQDLSNQIYYNYALTILGYNPESSITIDPNLDSDLLALAVIINYKNGDKNPISNGLSLLESKAVEYGGGSYWPESNQNRFGSKDASTAIAMKALIEAGGNEDLIKRSVKYLAENRVSDYWSSTYATSNILNSLTAYSQFSKELDPNYSYEVKLDDQIIDQNYVASSLSKEIEIPGDNLNKNGSVLSITKSGEGEIYSTLLVDEFIKDNKAKASGNGISIKRQYLTREGIDKVKVGDTVTVKLTVSGLDNNYSYGVIEDRLPAGLIAINTPLDNEQANQDYNHRYYSDGEITKEGKIIYLYSLNQGEKSITYKARAISEGKFYAPPAQVQLMYKPEVFARSDVQILTIGDKYTIFEKLLGKDSSEGSILFKIILAVILVLVFILALASMIVLVLIISKKRKAKTQAKETKKETETNHLK